MKALIASVICMNIFYLVNCYSQLNSMSIEELNSRYCALHCKDCFRYCVRENQAEVSVEFYKNCAQQVKFYQTLFELDNFICKRSSEKEYLKFLNCFVAALQTANKDLPNILPVSQVTRL
ncbi:uncharacterized protein LOC111627602 [Centruroides sculpturatus]|uniref:uncharacterized protein LOC111627602 n=1 Tax=Centruroides sculpturatus TaxID=218467 RepID=UPI000C6CC79E|nr:uncharacterized protein LOC111627602 [Centruroides sculpturatus]